MKDRIQEIESQEIKQDEWTGIKYTTTISLPFFSRLTFLLTNQLKVTVSMMVRASHAAETKLYLEAKEDK